MACVAPNIMKSSISRSTQTLFVQSLLTHTNPVWRASSEEKDGAQERLFAVPAETHRDSKRTFAAEIITELIPPKSKSVSVKNKYSSEA